MRQPDVQNYEHISRARQQPYKFQNNYGFRSRLQRLAGAVAGHWQVRAALEHTYVCWSLFYTSQTLCRRKEWEVWYGTVKRADEHRQRLASKLTVRLRQLLRHSVNQFHYYLSIVISLFLHCVRETKLTSKALRYGSHSCYTAMQTHIPAFE